MVIGLTNGMRWVQYSIYQTQIFIMKHESDLNSDLTRTFHGGHWHNKCNDSWTIAKLIKHPKVLKKLRDEINSSISSNSLFQESYVPEIPYLQAVIKKSLRLHHSSSLMLRRCEKDCKINGYDILANEKVIFNVKDIHMDPNVWENLEEFVPERFMNISEEHEYDDYQMDMKLVRDFK
ncbi:hypothetical protein M9H77_11869 [Catharanthus roseus]|uniref:Uncharacterized protein n=1 Tax=Catharanthus roseus TaxID=4058 RepID=A0ACC0BFV1_CATRO|nr:hypothetical protein M9H77_11869 [Catharanthus roseus]